MFYNNIDPVLFRLGSLEIRYYGLLFLSGFIIAYFLIKKLSKERNLNLNEDDINWFPQVVGPFRFTRYGNIVKINGIVFPSFDYLKGEASTLGTDSIKYEKFEAYKVVSSDN